MSRLSWVIVAFLMFLACLAFMFATLGGCATTGQNRSKVAGVSLSDKPAVSPPPYFCTKDGTWESEKGHEACDLMCSLYRGQKWDRKQRECIDVCDLEKGMRWQHSEPQKCVTFCRGGEFLGWGKDGELICDCPSGQSWDRIAGKCEKIEQCQLCRVAKAACESQEKCSWDEEEGVCDCPSLGVKYPKCREYCPPQDND